MVDATWNGSNGNYADPNNWSSDVVPDQAGDLGIVTNGTIQLDKLNLTGVGTQISSQSNANPARSMYAILLWASCRSLN